MLRVPFKSQISMPFPPTEPHDVVNLETLESKLEGLRWDPVRAAATGNIDGAASPDGKTLTGKANGVFPTIDGVTPAADDRYLLPHQTDKTENGLWQLTTLGDASTPWVLTRTSDADVGDEFRPTKAVYVQPDGATYGDCTFKQTTGAAVTIGVTPIEFALATVDLVQSETYEITGDDSAAEFTVNHTLNTKRPMVQFFDAANVPFMTGWKPLSATAIKVDFGAPLALDEKVTVVLIGKADA